MTIIKTDTDVSNLIINQLTKSQYDAAKQAGQLNENELYFVSGTSTEMNGYHPTLFTFQWSDCLKNDIQWLRADTFSWHSGAVYEAAYEYLEDDYYSGRWIDGIYNDSTGEENNTEFYWQGKDSNASSTAPYKWQNNDGLIFYTATKVVGSDTILYNINGNNTGWQVLDYDTVIQTETVGSYTIGFQVSKSGRKIVDYNSDDRAADIDIPNIYAESGVAWYYILDTTNKRFKLPRTKFGFTGLRDGVGNYIEPGLPNITGESYSTNGSGGVWGLCDQSSIIDNSSGALYLGSDILGGYSGGTDKHGRSLNFDASRSNPIYGASDTVQSPATQMYLYFFVGNYETSALEQTAGLNTELFNDKVDLDLNNITNATKETIISWGMPDYDSGYTVMATVGGTHYWVRAITDGIVYINDPSNQDYYIRLSKTGSVNGTGESIASESTMPADQFLIIYHQDAFNGTGTGGAFAFIPKGYYFSLEGYSGTTGIFYPLKGAL